jgi:hypothetical protein
MPSFLGHPRANTIQLPAPVYATWNPAGTDANIALSNGNLTAEVAGPTAGTAYGTSATPGGSFDNGKRYIEIGVTSIVGSASGMAIGFADTDQAVTGELGDMAYAYAWRLDGYKENAGVGSVFGSIATAGDIVQLAIHAYVEGGVAKANIWFGLNGVWFGAGDPASGVNPSFEEVVAPLATDWSIRSTLKVTGDCLFGNFGNAPFSYEVPVGFGSGWGFNIV